MGYEKEAKDIQDLYLDGKKTEAAAAIPASFIEQTTLVGSEGFVRDRISAYKDSGVTSLNVNLVAESMDDRVRYMDKLRNMVDAA